MVGRFAFALLLCAAPLAAQNPGQGPLTRSIADALYCRVAGTCSVQNFTITGTCTGCTTGAVPTTRTVSTTSPLGGGGALSADLTLTCAACATSANNLSFFTATSSAQVAALTSDETGTAGFLVFSVSPALTGTPTAPTAAVDTNTTQVATCAMVLAQAASATPLIDGSAAVGTSTRFARGDHVHPTDTTRAALASPTFTGTPAAPTAAADTNTTQVATTAYYIGQKGTASPIIDGTATAGTSARFAPIDHVHPTDTSRLAAANVSGTTGKIAKFTGSSVVGDSILVESSSKIGVGATPGSGLDGRFTFFVSGSANTSTMQLALGYDGGNNFGVMQAANLGTGFTPLVLQETGNVGIGANPTGTGRLQIIAGSSTTMASAGGTIAFNSATTGNTAGTETDIRTTTLTASILANNGDGASFIASGSFAATASVNKRIIAYFGGTAVFDSGSLAITSASTWRLTSSCDRTSSSAVTCSSTLSSSATGALTAVSQETSVTGLTLTNTQIYKITGNGTNANDVVAHAWKMRWDSAP